MWKEKLSELFQRSILFALLLLLIGLAYSKEGVRGLPFPWLQGSHVDSNALLCSLGVAFIFAVIIDMLRSVTKKPDNISAAPPAVNINKASSTNIQDTTAKIKQTVRTTKSTKTLPKQTKSSKAVFAIIMLFLLSVLPNMFSSFEEQGDDYIPDFYDEDTADELASICYNTITTIAEGSSIGFDTPGIYDVIDWEALDNSDDVYFYTNYSAYTENNDASEIIKYCDVYSDEWIKTNTVIFKLQGENVEKNPDAKVVGVMILDNMDNPIYEAGDCICAGKKLNKCIEE